MNKTRSERRKKVDPRRPGRPSSEESRKVRAALLRAARELIPKVGYDAATTKMIAERAGANPAMIHYYFGDKAGLNEAMLQDGLKPLLDRFREAEESPESELSLEELLTLYMHTLSANPWLPKLVVREVLPENGRLRKIFVKEFAGRAARIVPAIIERERARGVLRPGLDTTLTTLSFASMAIFPFLASPVIERALGIKVDEALIERLIPHTADLFRHGTQHGDES